MSIASLATDFAPSRPFQRGLLVALLLALLSACGDSQAPSDSGSTSDATPSANDEACEHMQDGPFVDATLGADLASAGVIAADHRAYRVALNSGASGWLKFNSPSAACSLFSSSSGVTIAFDDGTGQKLLVPSSTTSVSECTEVAVRYDFSLAAAGPLFIWLEAAQGATTVTFVVEAE